MTSGQLVKASITPIKPKGDRIECMFNPKEYTLSKKGGWETAQSSNKDSGEGNFSGGSGATLSLQLFFDTYLSRPSPTTVVDVRVHTDKLWKLMLIHEETKNKKTGKGHPPEVLFQWGGTWFFKAVITNMQQQFTLFLPNGVPVRAMVTLELQQTEDKALMAGSQTTHQISEQIRRSGNPNDQRDAMAGGRAS